MDKLERWLKKRNGEICWNSKGKNEVVLLPHSKNIKVFIDRRAEYQVKLVTLLHECGHVECYLRRRKNKFKNIDGISYSAYFSANGRMKNGHSRALAILQDEMAAWERGENIARSMKIRFSRKVFEKDRCSSLKTYLSTFVRKTNRKKKKRSR